jgi:hypothetical protein
MTDLQQTDTLELLCRCGRDRMFFAVNRKRDILWRMKEYEIIAAGDRCTYFDVMVETLQQAGIRVARLATVDAHRRLERGHRLEEILSVRMARTVGWGMQRQDVCAGLRGARAEIEKRLDGSHWLRFRGRYLPLHACPAANQNLQPKSKATTLRLPIILGASPGSGHF